MHIKRVELKSFRRFSHLEIVDLPETAKLVLLAGPNGNGKSSLFDAFLKVQRHNAGVDGSWEERYYTKKGSDSLGFHGSTVEFHEDVKRWNTAFYFRSAYRNDPEFENTSLKSIAPREDERRFSKMIHNDANVANNYRRLVSQSLQDVFEREDASSTIGQFRSKIVGSINDSLRKVLPHLSLDSLGNPLTVGTFLFSKGRSNGYNYMNLSGGEKAIFDIILDYVLAGDVFQDAVRCIDEPEAHLNPRVEGSLLQVLYDQTPDSGQLWIATHSIGMLRRARDIEASNPGKIVVLDFDADFDDRQTIRPARLNRRFWQKALTVALDDLAALVAPARIIACEGGKSDGLPGDGLDAAIYNNIFELEFPDTKFISIGSSNDVRGDRYLVLQAVTNLIYGIDIQRLVDRDGMSDFEMERERKAGIRVLQLRHLECYIFSDEVLRLLCDSLGMPEKKDDIINAKRSAMATAQSNGHPVDNVKAASGRIADACRKILRMQNPGRTTHAFMLDNLVPLIAPGTDTYENLKACIFD